MIRIALAAALLATPVAPNLAAATIGVTHHDGGGPASGRSPHKAYRPVTQTGSACRTVAIHVPAGKLPHYGSHQVTGDCAVATGLAAADTGTAALD
ncbi:hypothetical protein [Sphingomonas sp.]|uniref:hypothetical protein n=1 Tax=Sphingomonas sp. TaxID=28214 RepID=UPI003B0058F5